jgi:hypothetical protein
MDGVDLKDALAIAARYTNPKDTERSLHVVVLRDGVVRATTHITGCEIPCPAVVGIDLAVDCAALRRMVGAIGDGVKLSTGKGRKLVLEGAGVKYTLQAVPQASEPKFPKAPEGGWIGVTKEQMSALSQIATVVDEKSTHVPFHGVRLTEHWCGAATTSTVAFAWIAGLVEKSFTCPPAVFEDINAAAELCLDPQRLFLRGEKTGEIRWSLGLDASFPDESISTVLTDARGKERIVAQVRLTDLALLCKQAAVVADNKAQSFKLTMESKQLVMEGKQGVADFLGQVPVEGTSEAEGVDGVVGIDASRLELLSGVVASAGGDMFIAVAGPTSPVMIWNHDAPVIIETLTMPMRLE